MTLKEKAELFCTLPAHSRIMRTTLCGLLMVLVMTLPYLLQLTHSPSPFLGPSPVGNQQIPETMALNPETLVSEMSSSTGQTDAEDIETFARTVLGYDGMPDQCNRTSGSSQQKTASRFDLRKWGPYEFLPNYRNPCWHLEESRELRCLPYFYLAGFPKCGTTDMFRRLVIHPLVLSTVKEPHWITRRRLGGNSVDGYTQMYANYIKKENTKRKRAIVGDASASTLWDNHAWARLPGNENCTEPRILVADYIRHMNPNVKIIVMMRNPSTRLWSEYLYFMKSGAVPSYEEFHRLVKENIALFNSCIQNASFRACVYNFQRYTKRIFIGIYTVFIEDWLLRFPRNQMHFVRLEDVHNGSHTMPSVFNFLGLETDDVTIQNIAHLAPHNVGKKSRKMGPMWAKTRRLLEDFYRPFNRRLAHVLQDRRFTWEDDDADDTDDANDDKRTNKTNPPPKKKKGTKQTNKQTSKKQDKQTHT